MQVTRSHKFLGGGDEPAPTTAVTSWDEILDTIPELVTSASAVTIGYMEGERWMEFVTGDLDEVYRTRLDGLRHELEPFIRVICLYLNLQDDWFVRGRELLFLSVCTHVVMRAERQELVELLPAPRGWDELRAPILDILTCKKAWW